MKRVELIISSDYSKEHHFIEIDNMDDLKKEILDFLKTANRYRGIDIEKEIKKIGISESKSFWPEEVDKWIPLLKFLKKEFKEVSGIHYIGIFRKI